MGGLLGGGCLKRPWKRHSQCIDRLTIVSSIALLSKSIPENIWQLHCVGQAIPDVIHQKIFSGRWGLVGGWVAGGWVFKAAMEATFSMH